MRRMHMAFALWICCLCPIVRAEGGDARQVRRMFLKRDDIAVVRTALGIATIIQVPDRPTSVVLGDTSAFRVEYLETAITIKPLARSSKSNLYIYTEARRFNVNLVTASQPSADYIVYLNSERPTTALPKESWRKFRVQNSNRSLKVSVEQIGKVGDCLGVRFSLSSKTKVNFGPEWIWTTQNGKTVAVQGLNLSGVVIDPKNEIHGLLTVRRNDLNGALPIMLEVRSPTPISVKLPRVDLWMK